MSADRVGVVGAAVVAGGGGAPVRFNVGGKIFETSRLTLDAAPAGCLLASMITHESAQMPAARIVDGAYCLDVDPKPFGVVLNWLRHRELMLPPTTSLAVVRPVAAYLGVTDLVDEIRDEERKTRTRSGKVSWSGTLEISAMPHIAGYPRVEQRLSLENPTHISKIAPLQQQDSSYLTMKVGGRGDAWVQVDGFLCPSNNGQWEPRWDIDLPAGDTPFRFNSDRYNRAEDYGTFKFELYGCEYV